MTNNSSGIDDLDPDVYLANLATTDDEFATYLRQLRDRVEDGEQPSAVMHDLDFDESNSSITETEHRLAIATTFGVLWGQHIDAD